MVDFLLQSIIFGQSLVGRKGRDQLQGKASKPMDMRRVTRLGKRVV